MTKHSSKQAIRTLRLWLSLTSLVVAHSASAQTATLFYDSEAGDFIGQGQTATYTEADGSFTASRNFDEGVTISFDHATQGSIWWDLSFAAPFSVELTAGTYTNAQRFPFQDNDKPGLSFTGSGRGCNTLTGQFTVDDVVFDWFGVPRRFSASLEQHCEGAVPALFAEIDYDFGGIGPVSLTEGNVLVIYKNLLHEYTVAGALVQRIPILESDGDPSDEDARDVIYDDLGQIHIFNGTFDPVLSSLDPASGAWRHDTFADWGIFNNVSYGGIAALAESVFVTDQSTSPSGIVVFDAGNNYAGQRFADGKNYIDLTIGHDGLLYALQSNEDTVDVYDPLTQGLVATVSLANDVRGIAVDAAGKIFGASWDGSIYRFSAAGAFEDSIAAGIGSLADIDLSASDQIVVGARFDDFAVTDTTLAMVSTFSTGSTFDGTFVAFVEKREDPQFFTDGFESGDVSVWSMAVGVTP